MSPIIFIKVYNFPNAALPMLICLARRLLRVPSQKLYNNNNNNQKYSRGTCLSFSFLYLLWKPLVSLTVKEKHFLKILRN